MRRKGSFILLMCACSLLLTGCWDNVEINNRSVILEFILDKSTEEEGMYRVTYDIPDMAKLSGTSSLAEDVQTSLTVDAATILENIEALQVKTQNTLSFSHVKGVLIGEELAKDPEMFKTAMDSITRAMLLPRNIPILLVPDRAEKVSTLKNPQNPILGLYLMNYFSNKERPINAFRNQLVSSFIREMQDYEVATMPVFHMIDEKTVEISGGAVIKDYMLKGYLDKEEVKGQLLIEGTLKNAPVVVQYEDKDLTYNVKRVDSKIRFEERGDGLACVISLVVRGNIGEYISEEKTNLFNQYESQQMSDIRKLLADQIIAEAQVAIDKSKEMNVDFLRIGLEMYRRKPDWWRMYQEDWYNGKFEELPVELRVDVSVQNTGILQ